MGVEFCFCSLALSSATEGFAGTGYECCWTGFAFVGLLGVVVDVLFTELAGDFAVATGLPVGFEVAFLHCGLTVKTADSIVETPLRHVLSPHWLLAVF